MLRIIKTKSDGKLSETISATNTKYFSSISAGVNEKKMKLSVNHNFDIPEGYYVSGVELINFRVKNGIHYAKTMEMIIARTLAGKKLTEKEANAVNNQLKAINCDVVLPDGTILTDARIDLRGTMGEWLGDWKKGNVEYAAITDKSLLASNFLMLIGKDIKNFKGRGTMFTSYESKH